MITAAFCLEKRQELFDLRIKNVLEKWKMLVLVVVI